MAYSTVDDVEYILGRDTDMDVSINEYIEQADNWINDELEGFDSPTSITLKHLSADYAAYLFIRNTSESRSMETVAKASELKKEAKDRLNAYKKKEKTYVINVNG